MREKINDLPNKEILDKPEYPIGIGNKKITENIPRLEALEVKNEVLWVNDQAELPFDIKVGESNRLGMFLTPAPNLNSDIDNSPYHLEIRPGHRRSGILGRVILRDKGGRLYRDIDLKGMGFISVDATVAEPEVDSGYPGSEKTLGILDESFAWTDIEMNQNFIDSGIRTHLPVALIKLEEIIDKKGDKISIVEAKERGLVKESDEPVIEVRAFGTRARIEDVIYTERFESKTSLNDAITLVAQELGMKENEFNREDYFNWMIETMAINLARMHFKNWIHGYLTPHNITLDGRIIDLDSVETTSEIKAREKAGENIKKSFKKDISDCRYALRSLGEYMFNRNWVDKVEESLEKIYDEETKRLKINKKNLKANI